MTESISVDRLTGARKGLVYTKDLNTEINWGTIFESIANPPTNFDLTKLMVVNAYDFSLNFAGEEIDVTAYGDFPFKSSEAGFSDVSINLSTRHAVRTIFDANNAVTAKRLAFDLLFLEEYCLKRLPFRVALLDNQKTLYPNGFAFTVTATSVDLTGGFGDAQDHSFSLKFSSAGLLKPKRIIGGKFVDFDWTKSQLDENGDLIVPDSSEGNGGNGGGGGGNGGGGD